MALPELLKKSAEKILADFCRIRTEKDPFSNRTLFRVEEDHVTVFLDRKEGGADDVEKTFQPVARLRFDSLLNQWTLHYPVAGDRWAFYLNAGPSLDLEKLLRHLDQDPLHVFWPQPD